MVKALRKSAWVALLLSAVLATRALLAAEPTLAQLQAPGPETASLTIVDRSEPQFLQTPASALTWKLTPAAPLPAGAPPNNRLIDLYTGTATAPVLLCRVLVRYYRDRSGWMPYFQLNEEPLLTRVNGRWQPIELAPGIPALIAQKGNAVPTPEGFFPSLEFGLTSGSLTIVGWRVR